MRPRPVIVLKIVSILVLGLAMAGPGFCARPSGAVNSIQALDVQMSEEGAVVAFTTSLPVPRFTCTLSPSQPDQVVIDFPDASSRLRKRYVLDNPLIREAQVLKKPEPGLALRVRLMLAGAVLVSVEQGRGLNLRFQKVVSVKEASNPVQPQEYRVGAGDKIEVAVYGHSDLDKVLEVRSDGMINYPLVGDVQVHGKTPAQIDEEITRALAKDYVIDPKVSVDVREYGSQWVTVIGEIKNPGRYMLKGNMHLIDVLATAGGLTTFANRRQIQILRGDNGVRHKSTVNLKSIEEGESPDLPLQSSDIVIVPRRAF